MISIFILVPIMFATYFLAANIRRPLFNKRQIEYTYGIVFFINMFLIILTDDNLANQFDSIFIPGYTVFKTNMFPHLGLNHFVFILKTCLYISSVTILMNLKFQESKSLKLINLTFLPFTIVLNIIGLPFLSYGFTGSNDILTNLFSLGFNAVTTILGLMIVYFIRMFKTPNKKLLFTDIKLIIKSELLLFVIALIATPIIGWGLLLGRSNLHHVDFSPFHIVIIITSLLIPIIGWVIHRFYLKDNYLRDFALYLLTLTLFISFFDWYNIYSYQNLGFWPIDLCNLAVPFLFVSIWLRRENLFHFCTLINIPGAFFAIVLPGITNDVSVTSPLGVHFWYEHMLDFIIPLLALTMHYFSRPKLKNWLYTWFIFTIYFVVICLADFILPLINHPLFYNRLSVDYLFLNGDDLASFLPILNIARNKSQWTLTTTNSFSTFYPLHNLLIYIGLMSLTSMLYGLYYIIELINKLFTKMVNSKKRKVQTN